MELSSLDHANLTWIAGQQVQKGAKDRLFCRRLGARWLAFLKGKANGDPRIKAGAEQYKLHTDTLTRHARVAQHWTELLEADIWAATRGGYDSGYEHEPQRSIALLKAYRLDLADHHPDSDVIRLLPTDGSGSRIDILCGDALTLLKTKPDQQFHCCITSPPYFRVRDWGPGGLGMEATMAEYVTNQVTVFREVRRALRDDGVCWVVIGDRYASKARSESDHGRFLYHPVPQAPADDIPLGNLLLTPHHLAIALQADGWVIRADIAWDKVRQVSGGVKKRPIATHDRILMLTKRAADYYYAEPPGEQGVSGPRRSGPFARMQGKLDLIPDNGHRYSADVLRISPSRHEGHTAPFPLELARWCAERTCPHGGSILDPFCGSGTAAVCAAKMGVSATIININPKFVALSKRRVNTALARDRVARLIKPDRAEAAD
jgi:DNA modification methylase